MSAVVPNIALAEQNEQLMGQPRELIIDAAGILTKSRSRLYFLKCIMVANRERQKVKIFDPLGLLVMHDDIIVPTTNASNIFQSPVCPITAGRQANMLCFHLPLGRCSRSGGMFFSVFSAVKVACGPP